MFDIGDLIIYSSHGICRIDNICEKTYLGSTQDYYVLHPIENCNLKISIPVDNNKVIMLGLLNREEAEEIIESFNLPGANWIELHNERNNIYSNIVKSGNRKEIAKIVNILMRKKLEKKLNEKDSKFLTGIQNILFSELATSLNTTFEIINENITRLINESEGSY